MMSVWHLSWIVPAAAMVGFVWAALLCGGRRIDEHE